MLKDNDFKKLRIPIISWIGNAAFSASTSLRLFLCSFSVPLASLASNQQRCILDSLQANQARTALHQGTVRDLGASVKALDGH